MIKSCQWLTSGTIEIGSSYVQSFVLRSTIIYKSSIAINAYAISEYTPTSFGIGVQNDSDYYYFIIYNWGYIKSEINIIFLTSV